MTTKADSPIKSLRDGLQKTKSTLTRTSAKQVTAKSVLREANALVADYFKQSRPSLIQTGLDDESLGGLDTLMQGLLELTHKASLRTGYDRILKAIRQEINGVEVALLSLQGNGQLASADLDGKERRIAETLNSLVPSAGSSYKQACIDLRASGRLSYRGVASELRESLREALDHLAPDGEVSAQPGFKLESGQNRPTMKQKVRYILKSRGKNKTVSDAPENAVQIVDEMVGSLARAVYNRSSLSTHVATTKAEVQKVKTYVDVVLGELLEIA